MMKKSSKSRSISLLTQKTFIYLAATAFLLQIVGIAQMIASAQAISVPIGPHVLHVSLSAGLLPLLVFAAAYWLHRPGVAKTTRLFTATLMAFMFVMLQFVIDVLFTKAVFREQLGYGDVAAIWSGPWVQYTPAAIAAIVALLIAWYVLKKSPKMKSNTPSQLVQSTFVWTVVGSFVVGALVESWHTLVRDNGFNPNDIATVAAVMLSSIVVMAMLYGILFLVTRRSLPLLTRAFIATVYATMAVFIFGICGFLVNIMRLYSTSATDTIGIMGIALGLILYVSIVAIHKWRKAL